ncbi:WhiB family transcriptional regulator [Streptomyces bangladeshensis]|uniref:Transcriptional regulator WhiB n=1 Tax=Streptomyces bangladeshensis TaxID=295352 RepID=A0ABP5NJZ8_9ACTN
MSNYTGSVPDTARKTDWRTRAACQDVDPEIFFSALSEETAKAVCRSCPVVEQCLQFALDEDIQFGVYGGLNEDERRSLRRQAVRRQLTTEELTERSRYARQPKEPRTLAWLFEINTIAAFGDHLTWTGPNKAKFQGRTYTPKQVAFLVGRGRPATGILRSTCGTPECVRPEHIANTAERHSMTPEVDAA